ncbi:phospholipase D family protein [Oleiagrimonas sp. C23AA]|nr:phospholipase D family protein [Oleiagrimonas sp. C23AA]
MPAFRRLTPLLGLLTALVLLQGCSLSRAQIRKADQVIAVTQPKASDCHHANHCATPSPLLAEARQADAESTPRHPVHYVTLLESGRAALAARVNLIRAARHSIDVQTYIWQQDDVGNLMLDELVRAAKRGVKVHILADQLFSFQSTELLARLARTHANFQVRLYNPTFHAAETPPLEFAAGVLCCFYKFNQRMHNKLVLVDNTIGITGGRNYQDRYFGWDPQFDYRDRDVMVGGPAARDMAKSFNRFWHHKRATPLTHLRDVNHLLRKEGRDAPGWQTPDWEDPARVARLRTDAENPAWIGSHLLKHTLKVGKVEFFADLPAKTDDPDRRQALALTDHIMHLVASAKHQIVLQTPYLVLSDKARKIFTHLHKRAHPPQVIVSTNSLASTDAFAVYAMSYKHRKRYLKDYGFNIFELKPHPEHSAAGSEQDLAVVADKALEQSVGGHDTEQAGASGEGQLPHSFGSGSGSGSRGRRNRPVPLITKGVRTGLHAKSIVVDGEFAMVGSHNFDPRSDHYNTESGVIVFDRRFAQQVRHEILVDTRPDNAWVIAKRQSKVPLLTDINKVISTVSEHLPLFDFWPFRYATSYDLDPGCPPLMRTDPQFFKCYHAVGDFPEVNLPFKAIYTRLITAFGVGMSGIL